MRSAASRVLILGNSGFVGSHLERTLAKAGAEVRGFSSKDLNLIHSDSISRLNEVLGPEDTLVVISALTPDRGRDLTTLTTNIRMIENVCASLQDRSCAHMLYVSSDAVYAD